MPLTNTEPLVKNGTLDGDCGACVAAAWFSRLFTIAFAHSAAQGEFFSMLSSHQEGHEGPHDGRISSSASSNSMLQPFPPSQKGKQKRNRLKHILIHFYCICWLPESFDSPMMECDMCHHFRYMGINESSELELP